MAHIAHRITNFVSHHRLATLVALLVASEAIYLLAFLRRYPLLTYWDVPRLDMGRIANRSPMWAAEFIVAFVALFVLYAVAIRVCHSGPSQLWDVIILGILIFGMTLVLVFPIGAGDVFDYVVHGVLLVRHHVSPLVEVGTSYPNEPLMRYASWRNSPSYYGPLWSWMEAGMDVLAGSRDLPANLIGFKGLALLALLIDAWLIARIVALRAPEHVLASVVAFAWNPLVMFEAATNGHNDLTMLTFVLAALLAWERGRWAWAVVAMTLAVLIKAPPWPLLALLTVATVAQAQGRQGKLRRAAIIAALVVGTFSLGYLTFPQPLASLLNLRERFNLFTNSLPTIIVLLLRFVMPRAAAEWLARTLTLFAFELFLAWQAWRVWQAPERLLRACFETVAFLLLFVTPWFQPWYVTWLVAIAAACALGRARRLAGLFSLTVTWSYVVFGFVWFWFPAQLNWGNTLGAQAVGFVVTYTLPLVYLVRHKFQMSNFTPSQEPGAGSQIAS